MSSFPNLSEAEIVSLETKAFRDAVINASIVSIADSRGRITYVNENFIKISGYTREELLGKTHHIINSGYHPKSFWAEMWQTIAAGKTWRADVRNLAKDGGYYWVDTFIMPIMNENGTIHEYLSIRNDITAKKNVEQSLAESHQHLNNILKGITEGFFALDSELRFTLVSDVAARTAGKSAEDLIGKNIIEAVPVLRDSPLIGEYRKAFVTQKPIALEYQLISVPGQTVLVSIYPNADGIFVFFKDITEKRAGEEALREASELLDRLSRNVPGVIYNFYLSNGAPIFPFVSTQSQRVFGISADKLQNSPSLFFDIIHPDDKQRVIESIESAYAGHVKWSAQFRILRDNEVRWISGDSNPIQEKNGLHYWYGFMHDITDRKLAEQQLEESELKNRLIIENSGEGILFTKPNGEILSANPEACRMFDMTEQEICAGGRTALVDTEDYRYKTGLATRNTDGFFRGELRMKRKDGSFFLAELTSKLFVSPKGEVNSTILVRDVSRRKHAEEELRKLALIASKTSNAVVLTDLRGCITWVNEGFERITEYQRDEVIGKKPGSFLQGPATNPTTVQKMRDAISRAEGFKVEIINYAKSGRQYWLDIEVMPVHDQDGSLTGFMAIESDITSLKTAIYDMQRSERTLFTFLEYAPMLAYMKNENGAYTFCNHAFAKELPGKDFEPGTTDHQMYPLSVAEQKVREDAEVFSTGKILRSQAQSGNRTFIESKFPLRDRDNNIFGIGGISIDISELIEAQKKVVENEELLRNITNHLSEGFIFQSVVPAGGTADKFHYCSAGAQDVYEASIEDVRRSGDGFLSHVHPDDLLHVIEHLQTSISQQNVLDIEYRIIVRKECVKWLHTRATPKRNHSGETQFDGLTLNVTNRKKLELAVHESEAKLQSVFHSMSSGLVVVDTTGNITYSNESAAAMLLRPSTEVTDKHYASEEWGVVDEHGNPLSPDKIPLSIALREKKEALNVVIGVLDKAGERRWLNLNASPLFDRAGALTGAVATFIDITLEKNTQHRLNELYRDLNAVLDASTDSTFFLDKDYRIRVFNKTGESAIKKIFGKQVQLGDNFLDYSAADTREDFKKNFLKALSGTPVVVEREIRFNETVTTWNQVRYLPVLDDQGNVVGVSFNATNISERKVAEQKLFESKQYFESLVNSQSSFLIRTDLDGRYKFANNAFARHFLAQPDGLNEHNLFDAVLDDHRDVLSSVITACRYAQGKVIPVTLQLKTSKGQDLWMDWEFVAITDEKGVTHELQAVGFDRTDKILSKMQLEKANQRLRMATLAAKMGVWDWDVKSGALVWDDFIYQLVGLPVGTPINDQILHSVILPDDLAALMANTNKLSVANPALEGTFRIKRKNDGALRYIRTFAMAEFDNHGSLAKLIGVNYDVTEQELATKILRESEERFRTMADTSPVFIWMANEKNDTIFFSKQWYEFTGKAPADELGKGWLKGIHPDDLAKTMKDCSESFAEHKEINMEYRLQRHDGVYRWILDTGVPRFLETGEFLGYIGSCIDITDRKEAEAALASKTHFLEAILSTIDMGVIACDAQGEITLMNRAAEDLYEITADQMHSASFRESFRYMPFIEVLRNEKVEESEFTLHGSQGEQKFIVSNARQLKDVTGKTTGAVIALHDISFRKYTEDKLRQALSEKELLIKEIHHRIKNNLQLISSILYIKVLSMKEPEVKAFLNETRHKIRSIALIHERLLQTENVNQVDIQDYLTQLIEDLKVSIQRGDVLIEFSVAIESAVVSIDTAITCGLIINELVTNAIKHAFTGAGSGKIKIGLRKNTEGLFTMNVYNTGKMLPEGIAPGVTPSFGMQFLDIFIKQLNASLEINRRAGTEFVLNFRPLVN